MSKEENKTPSKQGTKTTRVKTTIKQIKNPLNINDDINDYSDKKVRTIEETVQIDPEDGSNTTYQIQKITHTEQEFIPTNPEVLESEIHHRKIINKKSLNSSIKQNSNTYIEDNNKNKISNLERFSKTETKKQKQCICGLSEKLENSNVYQIQTLGNAENVELIFPYENGNAYEHYLDDYSYQNKGHYLYTDYSDYNNTQHSENQNNIVVLNNANLCTCGLSSKLKNEKIKTKKEKNRDDNFQVQGATLNVLAQPNERKENTKNSLRVNQENNWQESCYGQNIENMQIIGAEKPKLTIECLGQLDIKQEKIAEPIQLLVPVPPNDIDYVCGLEVINKKPRSSSVDYFMDTRDTWSVKSRTKKVLLCPENIDVLNIYRAYTYEKPENEKESLKSFDIINTKPPRQFSVEKSDLTYKSRPRPELFLENTVFNIYGEDNYFNRVNQPIKTVKMNVDGLKKVWITEPIKTTKMNIEGQPKKEGTVDEVNKVYISDHYPLIAQFEIKNSK